MDRPWVAGGRQIESGRRVVSRARRPSTRSPAPKRRLGGLRARSASSRGPLQKRRTGPRTSRRLQDSGVAFPCEREATIAPPTTLKAPSVLFAPRKSGTSDASAEERVPAYGGVAFMQRARTGAAGARGVAPGVARRGAGARRRRGRGVPEAGTARAARSVEPREAAARRAPQDAGARAPARRRPAARGRRRRSFGGVASRRRAGRRRRGRRPRGQYLLHPDGACSFGVLDLDLAADALARLHAGRGGDASVLLQAPLAGFVRSLRASATRLGGGLKFTGVTQTQLSEIADGRRRF